MSQAKFLILVDENMSNAVAEQLQKRGVDTIRVIDVLPTGTDDDAVLEYAAEHGYSLVTYDQRITEHIKKRVEAGKQYSGVFIAGKDMRGEGGIGRIVEFIAEYHELIKGGAATLQNDIYNETIYIR